MHQIKKMLQENGIKPTFQRIKILEFLKQNDSHPTVEIIFNSLYNKVPTLSKATVYNTLDIFRKKGLVNALTISETELRYEYNIGHHHHFHCRKCGKTFDIEVECPFNDNFNLKEHKIEEIHGYFRGVCSECLQKEKNTADDS